MFSIKPRIEKTWHVVFTSTTKKRWYNRFLKDGFDHVYLMQKSDAGLFWIVIDPKWSHTEIDYRMVKTFPTARDYAGPYAKIVQYTAHVDPESHCTQLNILQCTDIAKRFMGIRKWRIFTPYQLYKYLRLQNGRHNRIESG